MMVSVKHTKLIEEVFNDHHIVKDSDKFEKGYSLKCECLLSVKSRHVLHQTHRVYV